MAFENFPQADQPTKGATAAPKNNMRTLLTTVLVVALLGTWGYIIYDKNQTKETLDQKETIIASTSSQRDELQKELEDAAMRYDMLKSANTKLDSTISAKDRDIEGKRTRIQSLLNKINASAAELAEAKRLIASLNGDLEGYQARIEILEGEKIQLTQEKNAVTQQRDMARREYDSASIVIKEKEDLLNVGSTLQASNFNIVGVDEKRSGKEKNKKLLFILILL